MLLPEKLSQQLPAASGSIGIILAVQLAQQAGLLVAGELQLPADFLVGPPQDPHMRVLRGHAGSQVLNVRRLRSQQTGYISDSILHVLWEKGTQFSDLASGFRKRLPWSGQEGKVSRAGTLSLSMQRTQLRLSVSWAGSDTQYRPQHNIGS